MMRGKCIKVEECVGRSFNRDNIEMMCTDITVHELQHISLFLTNCRFRDLQFKL